MKAAITDGKGNVEIKEVSMPKPNDYECLCEILSCATCTGTDQKLITNHLPWKNEYPGILGHESVGRIIETGKKVKYLQKGDIVLRPCAIYPGEKFDNYFSLWGGYAEFGLVTDEKAAKEDNVEVNPYVQFQQKLPSDLEVSFNEMSLIITLKEIAGFINTTGIKFNTSVVILGTGMVAKSMAYFAKLLGAYPIISIGRRQKPLDEMLQIGSDFIINNSKEKDEEKIIKEITNGKGANYVLDAAGNDELVKKSVNFLAPYGEVVLYAMGNSFDYTVNRATGPGNYKIYFNGPAETMTHDYLIKLIKIKAIPFNKFYSHILPLSEISKGFDMIKNKEAFKILFEIKK